MKKGKGKGKGLGRWSQCTRPGVARAMNSKCLQTDLRPGGTVPKVPLAYGWIPDPYPYP